MYIESHNGLLIYTVLNPKGNHLTAKITEQELRRPIPSFSTLNDLAPLAENILSIIAKRGHTRTRPFFYYHHRIANPPKKKLIQTTAYLLQAKYNRPSTSYLI